MERFRDNSNASEGASLEYQQETAERHYFRNAISTLLHTLAIASRPIGSSEAPTLERQELEYGIEYRPVEDTAAQTIGLTSVTTENDKGRKLPRRIVINWDLSHQFQHSARVIIGIATKAPDISIQLHWVTKGISMQKELSSYAATAPKERQQDIALVNDTLLCLNSLLIDSWDSKISPRIFQAAEVLIERHERQQTSSVYQPSSEPWRPLGNGIDELMGIDEYANPEAILEQLAKKGIITILDDGVDQDQETA